MFKHEVFSGTYFSVFRLNISAHKRFTTQSAQILKKQDERECNCIY